MSTVSYRKYSGKKSANIKPMVILIFIVGLILVVSVIIVIVGKIVGSQSTIPEDESMIVDRPGTILGDDNKNEEDESMISKIAIKIGEREFTATLAENETAQAFARLLPIEKNMVELNGNEKYYDLHQNLPSDSRQVGRIEAGDLMLFQNNFIVVFYKAHSTSYSYTRIGKIDDPAGLAEAVGDGDVVMSFAVIDDSGTVLWGDGEAEDE